MVECKCLNFIHKEKIPMAPTNKHRKGQHLTFECRVLIQTRLKDGWSPNRIAKKIGCAPNTFRNFAHPYTSCEKGSVDRHNGLIRRLILKGKRIDSYSNEQIAQVEFWCNRLPRKLLGCRIPNERFEPELDRIYPCAI